MKENVKKSKRLVSAGIFIALYFVVFIIFGCVCMPVPVLYLCMSSIIAFFAAPVYMMLLNKAPIHGPVFIVAMLPCLFLLLQGNIWIVVVSGVLAGILAEVVAGIGKFKSKTLNVISYILFSQNLLGGFLPVWVMREFYFEGITERGMSIEFCDSLRAITPVWVLFAMIAATAVFAVIGVLVGNRLFKKHFEKAGIVA